ncbi:hypothetical protein [Pseudonocardia yuanmonensis]|uniref:hypothetical protein n=1 Tax=Pseudonocardia yuanmonensis TaxID=1095914 RepID=UPI0031E9E7C6
MAPVSGELDGELSARLLRGLRIAQTVITLVILFGLTLPNLLAAVAAYHPAWAAPVGWALLVAVAAVDALLVARHCFWGRARAPVALGVLALAVTMPLALDPAELGGPAQGTLGVVGWIWVLLFAGAPLRGLVALILGHLLIVLGLLVATGRTDRVTLVAFGITAVAVTSFQLAVALAGSALRAVARQAVEAAESEARARTAEEVARTVHADREARYAELRAVALPLLQGIGEGTLDPSDAQVQQAAARAAARLRRMFAEEGDADDALAAELAALIDIAERRGVVVRYSERGPRPVPPPDAAGALLASAEAALHAARAAARVTLAGVGGAVVVGVVTDGAARVPLPDVADVGTSTVEAGGATWVEARWAPRS